MPPRPSLTVYASRTTIERGESTTIFWESFNADAVNISHIGDVALSGSKRVSPTSTITYDGIAYSMVGSDRDSVTITVTEPPAPPPEPPPPEPPPPEPPEPPLPPTPEDCPDFWADPVGAVTCWIIKSIEATLGLVSGGFLSFITYLQQWSAGFTIEFWYFLQDPISSIKTWMNGVFVTIQDLFGQISSSISTWWTQAVIDVGIMITNATIGFSSWIDERFTGINDWWADAQTVWGTWWEERLSGLEDWINDFSTKVNNWYNSNIQPTIDAIQSRLNDFGDYIKGIPDVLGQWWQDRIIEFGVWIVEATAAANDFIAGFPDLIGTWWNDRVLEMGLWLAERNAEFDLWVKNVLPGIVEDMFKLPEWMTKPFEAIGQFATLMYNLLTGKYPEDRIIIEYKENFKEQTDRVKRVLGEP